METGEKLVSVDYEVFGKVQDVFFRKYTKKKARSLGLVGWVENTDRGTVVGQVQGPAEKIAAIDEHISRSGCIRYSSDNANTIVSKNNSVLMWIPLENPAGKFGQQYHPVSDEKDWLRLEGSPESKIEKCVFTKEGAIEKLTHEIFRVVE